MITLLVTLATMFTGTTCAGLDNYSNQAAWGDPHHGITTASYTDRGDRLVYDLGPGQWLPNGMEGEVMLASLKDAEAKLLEGKPGYKVVIDCSNPGDMWGDKS